MSPSPDEQWLPCPSFTEYHVSDRGRVRSPKQALTPFVYRKAWCVCLRSHSTIPIASLVAEAFLNVDRGDLKTTLRIGHRNQDPSDNRVANIRITPRRHNPEIDLERASALMDDGASSAFVSKLTGIPASRILAYRKKKRSPR